MDLSTLNNKLPESPKKAKSLVIPTFEGGIQGVKQRLEMLDSLIEDETGIHPDDMIAARTCVADVMIELKANPECAKLLVDKDIHNMLVFSRMTNKLAHESIVKSVAKRSKKAERAEKAKALLGDMTLDLGMGDLAKMDVSKIKKVTR